MESLGKRLVHIAHRDRWLLFSSLIETTPHPIKWPRTRAERELDRAFDHLFFKRAQRRLRKRDIV